MPCWNPSNCGELLYRGADWNPDCVGIERTLTHCVGGCATVQWGRRGYPEERSIRGQERLSMDFTIVGNFNGGMQSLYQQLGIEWLRQEG
jgi:hypothetical protein